MSSEGWVYSLETENEAHEALYEAELLREDPRSYTEIASDMYTDLVWNAFNVLGGLNREKKVSDSSEYQKIGSDIVPKNEDAKERLEDVLENQDLNYEITA